MAPPTLSLTQSQGLTALRAFLLGVMPNPNIEVIQAQDNLVPEPKYPDFVMMTPIRQERLATNETDYYDNVLTGSISGTVLTVSAIARQESPLVAGMALTDGQSPNTLAVNTVLGAQLGGATGGIGTYNVLPSQTVASETMYAGIRADLAPTQWTVQLDIHGPMSADNTRIIETLFRSEYAVDAFAASGFQVVPLYCDTPRQMPFENDQSQVENRWVMDAVMQINPIVSSDQLFATEVKVTTIEANTP